MKAYSMDLRERIFKDCDEGMATKDVAIKYRVSRSWVRRLKQRRRENGERSPRASGGARIIKVDRTRLKDLIDQQPDATLAELRDRLGVNCALSTLSVALKQLRYSFKKR